MQASRGIAGKRICVTGGAGFLGQAVCRLLQQKGAAEVFVPRSTDFDLTQSHACHRLYESARPDIVIHLAAECGGIGANQAQPGRFFYANMAMGLHLIEAAWERGIEKFVQVGTVCGYPKHCPVPFKEDDLFDGYPEETNAPYGIAKRALAVMLQAYREQYGFNGVYLIPVNLYGPGDNFDPATSHVIPALIRRFHEAAFNDAKDVSCWGSGTASREFLYVADAAEGIVAAAGSYNAAEPVNLGTGQEITIAELASLIARRCGYKGRISWDSSRPDGQPRRQLDTTRAERALGWRAKVSLEEGLGRAVDWWREQVRKEAGV